MKYLALKVLDSRIRGLPRPTVPPGGWIATVREALGLRQTNLARRLGIERQSLADLENSERRKTISIGRLDEVAQSMGAQLVYALVPASDESYEAFLRRRAREVAEKAVMRVERTMTLEAQQRDEAEREESVREIADDLFRSFSRELWAVAANQAAAQNKSKAEL